MKSESTLDQGEVSKSVDLMENEEQMPTGTSTDNNATDIGWDNAFAATQASKKRDETNVQQQRSTDEKEVEISFGDNSRPAEATENEGGTAGDASNDVESPEQQEGAEQAYPSKAAAAVAPLEEFVRSNSLLDEDDDDTDEEQKDTTNQEQDEEQQQSNNVNPQNNMGAQILMGRFSSWRQKANQSIKTNAEAALKTSLGQQLSAKAEQASGRQFFRNEPGRSSSSNMKSETDEGSTSMEEEGTATDDDEKQEETLESGESRSVDSSSSKSDRDDDVDEASLSDDESAVTDESFLQSGVAAAVAVRSAAQVVDSVATGFRGRYTGGDNQATPKRSGGTRSQTSLILQSRAAAHMQSILEHLDESCEYVLLLGSGMLGVNLKQTYLKNRGVYIDYMVESGAAFESRVVHVGDTIIRVGDKDVAKGTISTIPQTIADARRPVVLVLSTGQKVALDRVNYIDVAIAMMHRIRQDAENRRDISRMPLHHKAETKNEDDEPIPTSTNEDDEPSPASTRGDQEEEENGETTPEEEKIDENPATPEEEKPLNWCIPDHSLAAPHPANVPPIPMVAKESLQPHLPKRGLDKFSLSMLCQAAASMDNFRAVLKCAFVSCALDGRRLPFLSSHFSAEEALAEKQAEDEFSEMDTQKTTASTQLMLFLELTSFVELFGVTPISRRRDVAKRIAYKFFLPNKIGSRTEYPMFDFHEIVDASELKALESALNNTQVAIERDVFLAFQNSIVNSLSRAPFLTFLMSTECARMRGYLRDTAPYQTVSPGDILAALTSGNDSSNAHNHFMYCLVFSLCQHEKEIGGENDDMIADKGERLMGAASGLCCAMFIKEKLLGAIKNPDTSVPQNVIKREVGHLWETFLSPNGGALASTSHSNETDESLALVRTLLEEASKFDQSRLQEALVAPKMIDAMNRLAEDLIYDYTVNAYPKFKEHKFHEWLCSEMSKVEIIDGLPTLSQGSIRRLLRKAELPPGVSAHKPIRSAGTSEVESSAESVEQDAVHTHESEVVTSSNVKSNENADVAIVFGSDDGTNVHEQLMNPAMDHYEIRRYATQSVSETGRTSDASALQVPPTLEGYAVVPAMRYSPFGTVVDESRISADGWEVSLVNLMIPNAETSEEEDSAVYGVSLVFQRNVIEPSEDSEDDDLPPMKLVCDAAPETPKKAREDEVVFDSTGEAIDIGAFASPLSFTPLKDSPRRKEVVSSVRVSAETPVFNERLAEESWTERVGTYRTTAVSQTPVTVGVVLLSSRNVIFAMRETLSRLLWDFSRTDETGGSSVSHLTCGPLIQLLGNFSHTDVETEALKCILEPYLRFGSSPWIDRPLGTQKKQFDLMAGEQLIASLPPIPLALLFVTVMLEQKIVFSSSRRGLLLSAVNALTQLLSPLKWAHLLVPLVPSALARDLLQYPAPYILGIPSEDSGNLHLLSTLPDDVTLVDLDVGRVILAPSVAYDDDLLRDGGDRGATAAALRSQLLYLAQALGVVFGSQIKPQTWSTDSATTTMLESKTESKSTPVFDKLKETCNSFLTELLTGTSSCCYWIEEQRSADAPPQTETEQTVLFDEDRFFHVKNVRVQVHPEPLFGDREKNDLALGLDDFDLILECFLRGQCMSHYISSRPKTGMAFY